MPSSDTIDWNACILLRACEWLAERGREHHDAPRQLARIVVAWCAGKATNRDVIDAFDAMQSPAQTDDRAWSGVRHATVALAYMVLGRERAINAAVVQVETALSWVFDPELERCYHAYPVWTPGSRAPERHELNRTRGYVSRGRSPS